MVHPIPSLSLLPRHVDIQRVECIIVFPNNFQVAKSACRWRLVDFFACMLGVAEGPDRRRTHRTIAHAGRTPDLVLGSPREGPHPSDTD
jgi:hypothetical protein